MICFETIYALNHQRCDRRRGHLPEKPISGNLWSIVQKGQSDKIKGSFGAKGQSSFRPCAVANSSRQTFSRKERSFCTSFQRTSAAVRWYSCLRMLPIPATFDHGISGYRAFISAGRWRLALEGISIPRSTGQRFCQSRSKLLPLRADIRNGFHDICKPCRDYTFSHQNTRTADSSIRFFKTGCRLPSS